MAYQTKQLQFKAFNADADQGVFEGYASIAGIVDSENDIVEPGAFARTLSEGFAKNGVKLLALHNEYQLPVGKSLELREEKQGLYIKGYISPTTMGSDVRQLIKDGVLGEMSIGYEALKADVDEKGIRHLRDVELYEISIVTWPANAAAKIQAYKGGTPMPTPAPQNNQEAIQKVSEAVRAILEWLKQLDPDALKALMEQINSAAPSVPGPDDAEDDTIEIGEED